MAATDTKVATSTETAAAVETESTIDQPPAPAGRFYRRIFFGQATAQLSARAKAALTSNARWLKRHAADRSIVVEGHCSATGPAQPNQTLSEVRAKVVKDFLVEQGLDESQIEAVGYGLTKPEFKPAASGKNRRVVIKLAK